VAATVALMAWPALQSGSATVQRPAWGDLDIVPVVISPPLEYIPTDSGPIAPTRWSFARVPDLPALEQILRSVGLADADVTALAAAAAADPRNAGFVVTPGAALVRRLSPEVRARLYGHLAKNPLNFYQQAAFRFYGTSIDDWLGSALLPQTRALVDPLIYRDGEFLFFADIELVRSTIGRGAELQRLIKRLLRQSTMLVTLQVDDETQVEALAEYWGRGGRKTDIRPLLESVAEDPTNPSLDIAHLLPEMARRLLYRYPKVRMEDLEQPQLANCFWTALNFFNAEPDNRLLDPKIALQELSRNYYLVQDVLQLGDIVAFSDSNKNIFHVAVYLADDLVFTKNGYFSLAPWTILPMERLKGHYAAYAGDWHVTYYRGRAF
jgi:hypothetical protein